MYKYIKKTAYNDKSIKININCQHIKKWLKVKITIKKKFKFVTQQLFADYQKIKKVNVLCERKLLQSTQGFHKVILRPQTKFQILCFKIISCTKEYF